MKIKTSELTGIALDWAVKRALGDIGIIVVRDGKWLAREDGKHHYSTDWSQGGPIIEREKLELSYWPNNPESVKWASSTNQALKYDAQGEYVNGSNFERMAPTPLIAAMRCYVASKLGDEVDVPEELL